MDRLSSHQLASLEDYIFGPNHVPTWQPKIGAAFDDIQLEVGCRELHE